mmetsp:Transcript_45693/g.67945  ORF Transcript_45693/g.67945 Transcript_45693/m.67945 type:complete len:88 (-) Transcript_45693:49-312(-)
MPTTTSSKRYLSLTEQMEKYDEGKSIVAMKVIDDSDSPLFDRNEKSQQVRGPCRSQRYFHYQDLAGFRIILIDSLANQINTKDPLRD